MKIAITSTGTSLESKIDMRFGRCSYFVIFDDMIGSIEFIPNNAKDADQGAGIAAVEFIAKRNVNKVISGEFGMKIKSLLDSLKIQMIMVKQPDRTIGELIELLKKNISKNN